MLLSGSYDGRVRLFADDSEESIPGGVAVGHSAPVRAVKFLRCAPAASSDGKREDEETPLFVSASKDRTVRIWRHSRDARLCSGLAVGRAHEEAVEALAVSDDGMFCSGGWDKKVVLWRCPTDAELGLPAEPAKRRKAAPAAAAEPLQLEAAGALEGHSQAVSALAWPDPLALYSGSWDHSIRLWDPKTEQNVASWLGAKVVTSLSFNLAANLLASGHSDNAVRLWDPRQKEADVAKQVLSSHKGWVTAVAWCPEDAHLLASASHDATVKLWDMRSKVPLHTLKDHTDKVLCLDWHGRDVLVSGGADCKLRRARLDKLASDPKG